MFPVSVPGEPCRVPSLPPGLEASSGTPESSECGDPGDCVHGDAESSEPGDWLDCDITPPAGTAALGDSTGLGSVCTFNCGVCGNYEPAAPVGPEVRGTLVLTAPPSSAALAFPNVGHGCVVAFDEPLPCTHLSCLPSYTARTIYALRSGGLVLQRAYVGKSTVWRQPRARPLYDATTPYERRAKGFELRRPATWHPLSWNRLSQSARNYTVTLIVFVSTEEPAALAAEEHLCTHLSAAAGVTLRNPWMYTAGRKCASPDSAGAFVYVGLS